MPAETHKNHPDAPQEGAPSHADGPSWTAVRVAVASVLTLLGGLVTRDAWADIFTIATRSEEAGYILLVPIVAVWLAAVRLAAVRLAAVRRGELARCRPAGSWAGPIGVLGGAALFLVGYEFSIQSFWHLGAVVLCVGCLLTAAGFEVVRAAWPAFLLLGMLVPVPGVLRQEIALPLQNWTASATEITAQILGMDLTRRGNVLVINGQSIGIAEACNGLRMVLALLLAVYAFVFLNTLPAWVRVLLLASTPLLAIAANVLRLIPTVAIYGHGSTELGSFFHDVAGWAMVFLSFLAMFGVLKVIHWVRDAEDGEPHADEDAPESADDAAEDATAKVAAASRGRGGRGGRIAGLTRRDALALLLTVVLLAGFGAYKRTYPQPADAEPYLERVRQAVGDVPASFDEWHSRPIEIPADALDMLKPNAVLSRRYTHRDTGRSVNLLIVHCRTARDLVGHYPPVCYPSIGWIQRSQRYEPMPRLSRLSRPSLVPQEHREANAASVSTPSAGDAGSLTHRGPLPFTRYRFRQSLLGEANAIEVWNLLLVPGRAPVAEMDRVRDRAASYLTHFFGAGQVQLVFTADVPTSEQRAIVRSFQPVLAPVLEAVRQVDTKQEAKAEGEPGGA